MAGTNVPGVLDNNVPQFSSQVPGMSLPNRREFGQEGQALEGLGEGVQHAARAGAEIYDEIQRQSDISTASKSYVASGVSHAQKLQELKLTSPDGFVRDPDTNEIVKNANGSQRTIGQEYWDWADNDYLSKQRDMTPRAAAMFRQHMQVEIGNNTRTLQNDQLVLQRHASDGDVKQSMATLGRDNDRSPYPDQNPYYQDQREDGSINLRGNTDKINDQLRTLKLWTTQQGPADGKVGMYNPAQVQELTAKRLSEHSDSWVRSAVTDILENDTPRDHKNRVSTTAVQQVHNLRDVIEGKDPQSMRSQAKGLPTVNSTLTSEQADKWRSQLNSMLDGAKKIDKSDYELHLQQMKDATRNGQYQNFDSLVRSPEFNYLMHAAQPLGMTPEQQVKDMSDIFGNAAKTAGHAGVSDLTSDATKRDQISKNLDSFEKGFPQYASMLGVNFTGDMGKAVLGEAKKTAYSQLEEENRQFKDDPAKFAAGLASGANNQPRSLTMKGVEDKLYSDPSIFAPMKPMANGKPVITSAIREMKKIGSMGFGQGYEPNYLSKEAYEGWAGKIERSGNPEQVESMFQQLQKTAGQDSATVMDQLVKVGKLDPRYQTAQNLPTSQARIAAYSDIMSKGAAIEAYTKSEGGETAGEVWKKAQKENQDLIDYNNRRFGADSPESSKAIRTLNQTWASKYSAAMGVKGTTQSDAAKAANEAVRAQISPIANVQAQHNWFGWHWGGTGPASRVQFSRPDLAPDQQQTIQQNLLKAQSAEELAKYSLAPAPVSQGAYDFNKKLDAKWVAEHPFIWYPAVNKNGEKVYRMQYQGMNADGSPNGTGYDVKTLGFGGHPVPYEVKESDALKKASQ